MTSLVLSRMSFMPPGTAGIDKGALEMAEKLATSINYTGHAEKLKEADIVQKLTAIGCTPFTTKSIRRYKGWMEFKVSGLRAALLGTFLWLSALAGLIAYGESKSSTAVIGIPLIIVLIASGFVIGALWSMFGNTQVQWHRVNIGHYEGVISDEAARMMLKIKEVFPEAAFSVEELRADRVVHDPFLLAVIYGFVFHVAVWDEPEYTRKLRT